MLARRVLRTTAGGASARAMLCAAASALALLLTPGSIAVAAEPEARLLRDINDGPNGSAWTLLGEAGDRLYFVAGERGPRYYPRSFGMWVTNGARRGTSRIHDPSDSWGDSGPRVDFLGADDGALLFAKRAPIEPCRRDVWKACSGGFNPWRSDGTADGTQPIVDESGRLVGIDTEIVWLGGDYYFGGFHQELGNALFRVPSGGGVAHVVRAFSPKLSASWGKPRPIAVLGDRLVFKLNDRDHGGELWSTDGTEESMQLLRDIVPGKRSMLLHSPEADEGAMTVIGDRLFFQVHVSDVEDLGSWVTDGTSAGTKQLSEALIDFRPTPTGGPLVYAGQDEEHGREPWITDGTRAGTKLLVDIAPGPADGFTDHILGYREGDPVHGWLTQDPAGARRYFLADDGLHGPEPWVTDGTPDGTQMLLDIDPQPGHGSDPSPAAVVGERVYFSADDGINGRQLWASDGTPDTTRMITSLDLAGREVQGMVAHEEGVFVALEESDGQMSLWRVDDGTGEATRIWEGKAKRLNFYDRGSVLFFSPWRPSSATLWMTDGTRSGTSRVTGPKNHQLVFEGYSSVVRVGDRWLFYADDGKHGVELWTLRASD